MGFAPVFLLAETRHDDETPSTAITRVTAVLRATAALSLVFMGSGHMRPGILC